MRLVTLTTEQEGIGIATGCWLGGQRAMIAMQSSGVGNCINALGLPAAYRAPCLMLVTMRGQWGEFNPWQVPMGQATRPALEAIGVKCFPVDKADGGRRDVRGRGRPRLQQPRERGGAGEPAHHRRQGVRTEMSDDAQQDRAPAVRRRAARGTAAMR